jgi:hypothetical protein
VNHFRTRQHIWSSETGPEDTPKTGVTQYRLADW